MNYADKQVLIVEDQRPFLLLLRGLLNTMGATNIVTKPSAEQAIALCRKQKYDIIVADLHLGADKKNGFELIEELRVRKLIKPSTVFLLISADSARPVVLGSIERRPDDYLIKPFSQAQLKTRITRSWQKRQFLQPVYSAIFEEDWNKAIDNAEHLASMTSPYQRSCEQLLVELYWEIKEPEKALDVLTPYINGKPLLWAQVALGKTYLRLKDPDKAIDTAEAILQSNRFSPEAHDILAEAHDLQNNHEEAVASIKSALKISPFSLPRHFAACQIAWNSNDYVLAAESSKSIWDLSKRTVHQDIAHWCGYIRSILDVAEHSEEKRTKNRYQQEALLALQRGKFDEALMRMAEDFDIDIYEQVMTARVNAIDGKMLDARKHLAASQIAIENKYDEYPVGFAPDSVKVMFDLGEFDDAQSLLTSLNRRSIVLDANSQELLRREERSASDKQSNYQQFNRKGINLYQQGQYEKAKEAFAAAQTFAPVNTGVALNLLQCLIKILDKNEKAEPTLVKECRRVYKLLEDMPLNHQHQQKLDALKGDLLTYIG
nr:response regulator [Alteromonas antoniana]